MKKYFILFLLTISTFLTAQEEEQIQTASKWQIGQGNVAFGTSLSFTNVSTDNNSAYVLGMGDSRFTGNNLIAYRKGSDFGIFSVGSSGTYLAYGLNNESMIYVSTDVSSYISGDDSDDTLKIIGNNIHLSYVYSNKVNEKVSINFAPYITPFSLYGKEDDYDMKKYNFKLPYILGFNFAASIKSDSLFFDIMFNYNLNSKKELEEGEYDEEYDEYYGGMSISKYNIYSLGLYIGNNLSNSLTGKAGLLITSYKVNNRSVSQQLLQFAIENKISDLAKLGLTLEYVLESDMIGDETNLFSIIGKMEFVF